MPQLSPTSLTRYTLTAEEDLAGHSLTLSTQAILQNLLADACESRLGLEFDPLNPTKFAQDEAFLQGQMQILRYLLDRAKPQPSSENSDS